MDTATELEGTLRSLRQEAESRLADANCRRELQQWHAEFLGRKGRITLALRSLGRLTKEQRPVVGRLANDIKSALEAAFGERQEAVTEAEFEAAVEHAAIDVTLPGRPPALGALHPTTKALREICAIFAHMGFQVFDEREVETDEYNFELLNIPQGHPARDMWDTFYATAPGVLLRTHTSPGQIHVMRSHAPRPIRAILPGKCYRHEDVTARSESMFYQVEGLAVGRQITFSDLKGVLVTFARQMFGGDRRLRFRKSYFPFTEPSVEVDVSCILCGGRGCGLCKHSGWLEILGAGMVHPRVLSNGGYDPAQHTGFAFGLGPERIAMLKHGITDIRYFFTNDARFLERMA